MQIFPSPPFQRKTGMDQATDIAALVQRQLDAYNAHDVAALMSTYASDACQYRHPGELLASGADAIGARMAQRFEDPLLHATLRQRVVMGAVVIDHETIRCTLPDGPGTMEAVAIYQIRDGKIASSSVVFGEARLG
jgi:uncharacterized protein (TIGR02246 family)